MLGLGGMIWDKLGGQGVGMFGLLSEFETSWGVWGWLGKFETSWGGWRLSRLIWDWLGRLEVGWDAGGALSKLAGGLTGRRARPLSASWGFLNRRRARKNRFPAMHGCGRSGGTLQPNFIGLKTAKN